MNIVAIANSAELTMQWNAERRSQLQRMSELMESENGLVNPAQASLLLGTKRRMVRDWAQQGALKRYQFMGRQYFSLREVIAYRDRLAKKAKEPIPSRPSVAAKKPPMKKKPAAKMPAAKKKGKGKTSS